jgi:NADP-dependent 3-hydroxy acid dehydrogenase YdfG
VGDEATAAAFTKSTLQSLGHLDILGNNAGVSVVKALHLHTSEEWDAVMNSK